MVLLGSVTAYDAGLTVTVGGGATVAVFVQVTSLLIVPPAEVTVSVADLVPAVA